MSVNQQIQHVVYIHIQHLNHFVKPAMQKVYKENIIRNKSKIWKDQLC